MYAGKGFTPGEMTMFGYMTELDHAVSHSTNHRWIDSPQHSHCWIIRPAESLSVPEGPKQ